MPRRQVEVVIELWDYFSKFGFGDGDDGAAVDMGHEFRQQAIGTVNRHLAAVGVVGIEAVECDPCSIHNNCRIELVYTDEHQNELKDYIEVHDGTVSGIDDPGLQAKVATALALAKAEFDGDEAPGRDEAEG